MSPPLLISPPSRNGGPCSGFALLITITLLAFLVLLLVSLASLTRVETQVAANSQTLSVARQNALFALNLAIGQLQSKVGPDQRVTAPSSVGDGKGSTGEEAPGVDAKHPYFVGAWKNSPPPAGTVASRTHAPEFLGWLVSGNENKAVTANDYVTPASMAATLALPSDDPSAVWLLGNHSVEFTAPADADNPDPRIRLPKQAITSTSVPGIPGTRTIGNFAWWIGDEGIKAKTNLRDPFIPGSAQANETNRIKSAQLFRIDQMDGLSTFAGAANAALQDRIVTREQFLMGIPESALPGAERENARKDNFHHITVYSNGLLTDTLNGGLRQDLTHLLSLSQSQLQDELRTTVFKDISADPAAVTNAANGNQLIKPALTIPAWFPNEAEAPTGATWEQLRSYYNLSSAGPISSRAHTATQHGVHPLLIHFKMGVGLRRESIIPGAPTALQAHFRPVVVLANPYSVDLGAEDYFVFFRFSGSFGITNAANDNSGRAFSRGDVFNSIKFRLRSGGIPAGKAHVFTLVPAAPGTPFEAHPWLADATYEMTDSYDETTSISYLVPGVPFTDAEASIAKLRNRDTGSAGVGVSALLTNGNPGGASDIFQFLGGGLANASQIYTSDLGSASSVQWGGGLHQRILTVPGRSTSSGTAAAPLADINYRALAVGKVIDLNDVRFPVIQNGINQLPTADSFNALSPASFLVLEADDRTTTWLLNDLPSGKSFTHNVLFEVPQSSKDIVSVAQLQHMNPGGFLSPAYTLSLGSPVTLTIPASTSSDTVDLHLPTYAIGNSRASQFIAREDVVQNVTGSLYRRDASYLLNTLLFDRFYFSTVPQTGSFDFSSTPLVNARYVSTGDTDDIDEFRATPASAAAHMVTNGAFNVNSVSVEAWKAFLSATLDVDYPTESGDTDQVAYPRSLHQPLGSDAADTGLTPEAWAGFRKLSTSDVELLAQAIVREVRVRGPFLSISDFVNRRLVKNTDATAITGLAGTIEAAIENARVGSSAKHRLHRKNLIDNPSLNNRFTRNVNSDSTTNTGDDNLSAQAWIGTLPGAYPPNTIDPDHIPRHYAQGFPGWLSQADILQPLAPFITARSDTFLIRTYGDMVNPVTGVVEGRAWCEAVVQRVPDFVDGQPPETSRFGSPALSSTNQTFGRKFVVIHFRWLSADDI